MAKFDHELLKLDPEMITKIQLYSKADLGLNKVLILLKEEWPHHHFISRQVSNAILKAKHGNELDIPQVV